MTNSSERMWKFAALSLTQYVRTIAIDAGSEHRGMRPAGCNRLPSLRRGSDSGDFARRTVVAVPATAGHRGTRATVKGSRATSNAANVYVRSVQRPKPKDRP